MLQLWAEEEEARVETPLCKCLTYMQSISNHHPRDDDDNGGGGNRMFEEAVIESRRLHSPANATFPPSYLPTSLGRP